MVNLWVVTLAIPLVVLFIQVKMESEDSCSLTLISFVNTAVTSLELDCLTLVLSSSSHANVVHSILTMSAVATRLHWIEHNSTSDMILSTRTINADCLRPAVFCFPDTKEVLVMSRLHIYYIS